MLPLIIQLIYYSLASNDIRVLIFGLLKDYFKNQELKTVLKEENISEEELDQPYSIFNPNIIKKLIKVITPDEFKTIQSAINKVSGLFSEKGNTKDTKTPLNDKEKAIKKGNLIDIDSKGWIELSSSWFKKGTFKKNSPSLKQGLLTGLFQSDFAKNKKWYGPYTYPSFPEEIWILMTQQREKNGNGAGSVFWKYWLRSYLPSKLRTYVKKNLKDTLGISKGRKSYYVLKVNNINIQKTTNFINKLEKGFFRLKTNQNLTKTDIGSKAYRQARREIFTYHKNNNSIKNVGISIYKNKNYYKKYK